MAWRLARCLDVLRDQVNALHPGRATSADGTIGDARHQAEKSDHNPNGAGVVTAWDITTAGFTDLLAERLRQIGAAGDGRVKYVIFKGRIAGPAAKGWKWRPYSGFSQHFDHIHLSVSADRRQYDRTDPWPLTTVPDKGGGKGTRIVGIPSQRPTEEDEDEMSPQEWERLEKLLDDKIRLVLRGETAAGKPTGHYSLESVQKDIAALDVPRKKAK